jgi:CubicO group peptidase (beta-lactamase class C family)
VLWLGAALSAQDIPAKLDAYMAGLTAEKRFNGSVLVGRDGRVLLSKGYGMANFEHDVPNTPQTKFRLGSITKQFTAAAVMQLAEKGKLKVEDGICKFVDPCPEAWKPVTLHHLLSHTGGVPSYTSMPSYRLSMSRFLTLDALIGMFRDKPLDFAPGEKWVYSNSGYVLLGLVIERTSDLTYEQYLERNIFGPLKMANSGYDRDQTLLKHRAGGYVRGTDGSVKNAPYLDMSQPYAAGALYSTVEDLHAWDRALYTDQVVSKASRDRMFTVVKNNYGYGWMMDRNAGSARVHHGGGINGFITEIARYPDEKLAVIVLSNVQGSAAGKTANDLASIALGK